MTPDPISKPAEVSAADVLREMEWSVHTPLLSHCCPKCGRQRRDGHAPDCRIAAALAADLSSELAELGAELDALRNAGVVALIEERDALRAENERLKAEVAMAKPVFSRRQLDARAKMLEEALAPFARYAEEAARAPWMAGRSDGARLLCSHVRDGQQAVVMMGDLRRARAALSQNRKGNDDGER